MRQAAPKRQNDAEGMISETRGLILEEILKYHAAHNDTAKLKKLIDSEIQRLTNQRPSKIVRIAYDGTAGATSISGKGHEAIKAFKGSEKDAFNSNSPLPQSLWFQFSKPHRLAKIGWTAWYNDFAPRDFKVVGSSDCKAWTTIHSVVGASWPNNGKLEDISRTHTIPKENRMEFPCLGLTVTRTNVNYAFTVRRMMMWEEFFLNKKITADTFDPIHN